MNKEKEIKYVEWLGQLIIVDVPARQLTAIEYSLYRQTIDEYEKANGKIYKIVYLEDTKNN